MHWFLEEVSSILEDRGASYPSYSEEAEKISKVWSALYPQYAIPPRMVPRFMMIVKQVRDSGSQKDDHLVDLVGYTTKAAEMGHEPSLAKKPQQ